MKRKLFTTLALAAAFSMVAVACKKKDKDKKNNKKPAAKVNPQPKKNPPPAKKLSTTDMNKKCFDAFNNKDFKTARTCLADNAVQTMEGFPMKVEGGDAIVAEAKKWSGGMDGKSVLEITLINGTNVVNLMSWSGKNTGALPGMGIPAATNKEVSGFGIQKMALNDANKATSVHDYWDGGLLMAQLAGKAPSNHKPWNLNAVHVAKNDEAEKANLAALDKAAEGFAKGDPKPFLALFADDSEIYMNGMPVIKGAKGKAEFVAAMGKAFPDMKLTVKNKWAAGPYVFAEVGFTGTNKGAFKPLIPKATNKPVSLTLGEIYKMDGGKIKQQWVVMNSGSMLMQLGLIKPPAAAPAGDKPAGDKPADKKAADDKKAAPAKK